MKATIATTSLAGCFGCHMSILDIDERLLDLLDIVEFDKSPITDIKKFTRQIDIGLIEGGCCNSENIIVLKDFRKHCKILIAVGECAIMGGVPSMRNGIELDECINEAYISGPTVKLNTEKIIPNDPELPALLPRVYSCNEIVKIDYFLPGCPPRPDLIWEAITSLLEGRQIDPSYESLKFD
ncbi:MAG: hypothetical protein KAH10_00380 [Flavobacteriales bacterium]|nr:hypothetical protein [Flavobacteriales bacterium]